MSVLNLDGYVGYNWKADQNYNRIINTVSARKFQPPKKIGVTPDKNNSLQLICSSRVDDCQQKYRSTRLYTHKSYEYDSMNELERFGAGKYARRYVVIISFEDCLDFIYSCVFKTRIGDLRKFCKMNNMNYEAYSRQHLGGGYCGDLYITDLFGFSPAFDVVIDTMQSDNSLNRRLYFNKLFKFCEDFRNALLLHLDELFGMESAMILASAGITSAVYYSDKPIEGEIDVEYKMYKTKLKILCVERGKYFDAVETSLCS